MYEKPFRNVFSGSKNVFLDGRSPIFFRLRRFWSQSFNKKNNARKIIIVTLSETLKNEVFRAPQAKIF